MSLIQNLIYDFKDFYLHIPELEIPDNELTVLWGPSGSGKTTILRFLLGLHHCPGLKWIFQGEDLALCSVTMRKLGVVFQTLELFPHLSAKDNILFGAQARKRSVKDTKEDLNKLCVDLKLNHFLDRPTHLLSGGEKQRVALARALITKPRFLFLDEPFSSLDTYLRFEARQMLKKTIKNQNLGSLLITHDPEDVADLAQSLIILNEGKIIAKSKNSDVISLLNQHLGI